jgi:hypothetical protein
MSISVFEQGFVLSGIYWRPEMPGWKPLGGFSIAH